jgi:hypothetical protein
MEYSEGDLVLFKFLDMYFTGTIKKDVKGFLSIQYIINDVIEYLEIENAKDIQILVPHNKRLSNNVKKTLVHFEYKFGDSVAPLLEKWLPMLNLLAEDYNRRNLSEQN